MPDPRLLLRPAVLVALPFLGLSTGSGLAQTLTFVEDWAPALSVLDRIIRRAVYP